MKILIAADMEGVSGVTRWEEVEPKHLEYLRFRRIMTEEVNAAIDGAAEAGAGEFVVADGHDLGTNILIEELDQRARLHSGGNSPLSMVQGLDATISGVIFIGYHARSGSENAVLAHTWSSGQIANVWLNGILIGEYGLNAAVAGQFNVPVIMVSGDQTTCAQAQELLGSLETSVVKQSTGYFSAECLPTSITLPLIHDKARKAVLRIIAGSAPKPYIIPKPVKLTIEFRQPQFAERALRLPGITSHGSLTVEFIAQDMVSAFANFRAAVKVSYD